MLFDWESQFQAVSTDPIYGHFNLIRTDACDAGVATESMTVCGKGERYKVLFSFQGEQWSDCP